MVPKVAGLIRAQELMHRRLVTWGNVWLRGGAGLYEPGESDSARRIEWTGVQMDAARELNSVIIRLPDWRQNVLLQVFYKTGQASHWDSIQPREQRQIEAELTREVNGRIAVYRRETLLPTRGLNAKDFQPMRLQAITTLVTIEEHGYDIPSGAVPVTYTAPPLR